MSEFTTNIDILATTFETSVSVANTPENAIASTSLRVRTDAQEEKQVEYQEEKNADGDGDTAADVVVAQALDIRPPVSSSPVIVAVAAAGVIVAQRYKVVYTGGLWVRLGIDITSEQVRVLNSRDEFDCFPGVIQNAEGILRVKLLDGAGWTTFSHLDDVNDLQAVETIQPVPLRIPAQGSELIALWKYRVISPDGIVVHQELDLTSDVVREIMCGEEIECFPGMIQNAAGLFRVRLLDSSGWTTFQHTANGVAQLKQIELAASIGAPVPAPVTVPALVPAQTADDVAASSTSVAEIGLESSVYIDDTHDGFEMRGITLYLLQIIARLAQQKYWEKWDVARISNILLGSHELLKEGHRWGDVVPEDTLNFAADPADRLSVIDMLKTHHKDASNPHPTLGVCYDEVVGEKATIFVSFTYGTDFFELVRSLEAFVAANPEHANAYFWFDMLVNNQWVASEKDFEWWASTFKKAVGAIGHTLLVCTPWSDPEPLKRAWCLWEIFCTVDSNSKFDVALGSTEHDNFIKAILADAGEYYKMLSKINVLNSNCYLAEDKKNIFKAVEDSIGFAKLNAMVIGKMRDWVGSALDRSIAMKSTGTDNDSRVELWDNMLAKAEMLRKQGQYNASMQILQSCLVQFIDMVDDKYRWRWANTFQYIGMVYKDQGDYTKALEYYAKSLDIDILLNGPNHQNVGISYNNIAIVYKNQGKYDDAMEYYNKALVIKIQVHGTDHPSVGDTYYNMGILHAKQGDNVQALDLYDRALGIQLPALGPDHPDTKNTIKNMNIVKGRM